MSDVEYAVNFGSDKSIQFVKLSMAEVEHHGARLGEPIVRCRDCRRCMAYAHSAYCDKFAHALPDGTIDGFCAWGERRGDAE